MFSTRPDFRRDAGFQLNYSHDETIADDPSRTDA
jgi:hypothetical protein